jgi:hypothetical protein
MRSRIVPIAAVAAALLLAVPVLASHVAPEFTTKAESCGPLSPGTVELLVDATRLKAGQLVNGAFTVDLRLNGSIGNGSISFSDATLPVESVFVQGVTGGNLYAYASPVRADDGLVGPNGEPIKGVSFCYVTSEPGGTTGRAQPPATDTVPEADRSPIIPAALVGFGIALSALGLVLGVSLRPARRPR